MGNIILVTGGARSGKSSFAEKYAAKYGKNVAYIATAQPLDDEMEFRIQRHKESRPKNWHTYEAPYNAETVIEAVGKLGHDMILFDCITVYVSNFYLAQAKNNNSGTNYDLVSCEIYKLIQAADTFSGTIVFVTNEVGAGIVPENKMAREYRDLAGMANQILAKAADKVYLVVSGIPVDVNKLGERL